MANIGQQLKEQWEKAGIRVNPPATAEQLASFEMKHGVKLPSDLRDYFTTLNGMDNYAWDEHSNWFPALEDIKCVAEDIPAKGAKPNYEMSIWTSKMTYFDDAPNLFILCDQSLGIRIAAIRLGADPASPAPVFQVGYGRQDQIAGSFSEFAQAYLKDPESPWMQF